MSGAELRAYAMTAGAVAAGSADESGLSQRALALLDERDAGHLQQFGHLPGGQGCSLAPRGDAVTAAMAAVRSEHQGARWIGTTQEIVDELNRRGPWLNASITGPDPEVAAAREGLAAKMAQLHSGRLP